MTRSFAKSLAVVEARFPKERVALKIRRAGIDSISDLVQAAERSLSQSARFYIWLLGKIGGVQAEIALLRIMRSGRRSLWPEVAGALAGVGGQRTARTLTHIVLQSSQPARREGAAYALGFVDARRLRTKVIGALTQVLSADPEPRVRAQAAESLAGQLRFERGTTRRDAEHALIEHLSDSSADVRFWCAYAVGELRSKKAIPSLRRLASDNTVVPRWWQVGVEARDALGVIGGGNWPDRLRRAV